MTTEVDLRDLAITRNDAGQMRVRTRSHLLTRYVLPLSLICGFLSLMAWSARDLIFPPKNVTVMPVFSSNVEVRKAGATLFSAAGWIEPRPTPVRVAALAPGVVSKLLVVEDQLLKVGEPVAELVKDDAKLAHERTLSDLELREAELDEADASLIAAETRYKQPVHLEAPLGEAEASLAKIGTLLKNLPFEIRRAEADFDAIHKNYQSKLAAKGVVAGIEIDIAKSKTEGAKALVEELKDRSTSLEKEKDALHRRRDALKTSLTLLADEIKARDEAKAKVRAAKARVSQAKVVVAEAKLRLDRMTIISPIDGRVFHLIAHPGSRLGGGMTQMIGHDGSTIITMYRPKMLQARVDVRFKDVPQISLNQPVEINNDALPEPLIGKVLFISSEADIQKNTLQVKIEIPDPPPIFKPEMLVDVDFIAPKQPETANEPLKEMKIFVLKQLVQSDDTVWVADQAAGVARKVSVKIGQEDSNGLIEITHGLTASSRLILRGTDGLKDGDRINITREDTSFEKKGPSVPNTEPNKMNHPKNGGYR